MAKTFLISDTHFGHKNILTFRNSLGHLIRDGFKDIDHHNEVLIERWNSVVKPEDKVYHLGDVGFKNWTAMEKILTRLNGTKVLIKGNHDNHKLSQYAQVFKDVRAYHVLDRFILSHVPIHPHSIGRWKANIHGHLHQDDVGDPNYFNVSVEKINYTPIDFEVIRKHYD